ncbi:MAG: glycosyltransferase family 4 protein [Chloroflexi bacterium]|nr:glycosyltransferase family 4 protein [Chloroflexota bacterium]
MKVCFFLLDGDSNASSRHRVLQYVPMLREAGIEPVISRPVPERFYQRLVERGGSQRDKAVFYSTFLTCRTFDVLRAERFDAVVIQRDLFPFGPPLLERMLHRRNPHLVYDTDDATYLRPVFTPKTPFQRIRHFGKVIDVVRNARWVSAATEPIADWARQFNAHVTVVPMALDLREYDQVCAEPARPGGPLVLGWAGTGGGLIYLEKLAPVLREISAKHDIVVRVLSGGYQRVPLPGVPIDPRPWRPQLALREMAGFDIGLVPLDDTPFEQAKFPFKLLQYLALRIPSVVSRVGTAAALVRHGENGLLARSNAEWRDALESLLADSELRKRLATEGRRTVEQNYTIERIGPLLIDGLSRATA